MDKENFQFLVSSCLIAFLLIFASAFSYLKFEGGTCLSNPINYGIKEISKTYQEDGVCKCVLYRPNSPIFTFGVNYSKTEFVPFGIGIIDTFPIDMGTNLELVYLPKDLEFPDYLSLQDTGELIKLKEKQEELKLNKDAIVFYSVIPYSLVNNSLCKGDIHNETDCYPNYAQVFENLQNSTYKPLCSYVEQGKIQISLYVYHGHYNITQDGRFFFVPPHGQYELGSSMNLIVNGTNPYGFPVCNKSYEFRTIEYSKNYV